MLSPRIATNHDRDNAEARNQRQKRRMPANTARERVVPVCTRQFVRKHFLKHFSLTALWKYYTILTQPQPHVLPQSLTGQGIL